MLLAFCGLVVLAACVDAPENVVYQGRAQVRTDVETRFVKTVLSDLQNRSINENREYCGYIGVDDTGALVASPPRRGNDEGCLPDLPVGAFEILASFHTHAAYAPEYDSEVPSYDDLRADVLEGIDGYIATPGGRVWYNSAATKRAVLVCGENCIIADPNYSPDEGIHVADAYELYELKQRH